MSKISAADWLLDELVEGLNDAMVQYGPGDKYISPDKLFEILKRYKLMM
jgi:hypothetical protein